MVNAKNQWKSRRKTLISEAVSVSSGETRRGVDRNRVNSVVEFAVTSEAQRRDGRNSIVFIKGAVVGDGASSWMTVGRR